MYNVSYLFLLIIILINSYYYNLFYLPDEAHLYLQSICVSFGPAFEPPEEELLEFFFDEEPPLFFVIVNILLYIKLEQQNKFPIYIPVL